MKKLTLMFCVFALLIAATGAAYAGKPAPETFTITGYTTFGEVANEPLPNGRTSFHVLAKSSGATSNDEAFCSYVYGMPCQATCQAFLGQPCGVTGGFTGEFTFEEWGEVDLVTGKGKNNGVVTITTPDGTAVVRFDGKTDSQTVWGNFKVAKNEGTGAYADLKGQGKYTGNGGYVFSVTFTGKLKD